MYTSAATRTLRRRLGTALRTGAIAAQSRPPHTRRDLRDRPPPARRERRLRPAHPDPIVISTILGAAIGAVGWHLIVNMSTHSRPLLSMLVPTVLVLSLIPDVALLVTNSIADRPTAGVVALMVMHVGHRSDRRNRLPQGDAR